MKRFTVAWMSLIILGSVCVGMSDAAIDSETAEVLLLFDDGSGAVAKDASGNGNDAEVSGAQWVDGPFGTALEYDGVDDNVVITGYLGIGGIEPRTTVFWFQSKDAREHSWVKWGPNVTGEKYYIRAHLDGANCYLRVEVAGGQNYGDTNVCDGEWHHLAVVFPDGSDSVQDHDLYVDGTLEPKTGGDQVMDTNIADQEVNMGDFLEHHSFMFGSFDEVGIFNAALTEADINMIMTQGLAEISTSVEPEDKLAITWGALKSRF